MVYVCLTNWLSQISTNCLNTQNFSSFLKQVQEDGYTINTHHDVPFTNNSAQIRVILNLS